MLEGRGGCTSRPTRAGAVETMLLAGLPHHLERLDDWLAQQLAEGEAQREDRLAALTQHRRALSALRREHRGHQAMYAQLLAEGDRLARLALTELERCEGAIEAAEQRITDSEAEIAEITASPTITEARAVYERLLAVAYGELQASTSTDELAAAIKRLSPRS
jgi:hypothetical protein